MAYNKAVLYFGFISVLWKYLLCPLVSFAIFLEVGPQNQTVVEGDRVTLICNVNNDNENTIFWTYLTGPERRRFISGNDYIYPSTGYGVDPSNYKVVFDQSHKIYTLVIKSINLSTEAGIYDCGYEHGSGRRYNPLGMAMITVLPFRESFSCHLNRLISLGMELNQQFEAACFWTHNQPGEAYFDSSSGETIDVDFRFPNHIISRIDTPTIICVFMRDNDAAITVNTPCSGEKNPGLVRVDPFIAEVTLGSNASFVCTSYFPEISWDLSVNAPYVSQERLIKKNEVMSIINVQDDDQYLLIECKVHIYVGLMVSSYASLRIVEVTTPPTRRLSLESQSYWTTEGPTTENSDIALTTPGQPYREDGRRIALAVLMIFCVASVVTIILLVRRRNRGSLKGCNEERSNELPLSSDTHTYSNKLYHSDVRLDCSIFESGQELNLEFDHQQGTCQECQTDMTVVGLRQESLKLKPLHLQDLKTQSLDSSLYEGIPDEPFTSNPCVEEPKVGDSGPDKEQEWTHAPEQMSSNCPFILNHRTVPCIDLDNRPLPECPKDSITKYNYNPSSRNITTADIHTNQLLTPETASLLYPHTLTYDFEDNKSGDYIDMSQGVVDHLPFTEDIPKSTTDVSLAVSGETSEMKSTTFLAERGTEICHRVERSSNGVLLPEATDDSDDPSQLDNRYISNIEHPVFNISPSRMFPVLCIKENS